MRALLIISLGIASMASAAVASPSQAGGEVNYPRGALGYDALVSGDISTAELQLQTSPSAANDPARMINMGYVYLQSGRYSSARHLFESVRDSRQHFTVELADGSIADTRDVARRALSRLAAMESNVAAR